MRFASSFGLAREVELMEQESQAGSCALVDILTGISYLILGGGEPHAALPERRVRSLYFLAIVYSPEQSQVTVWSGLAVPLQVPLAFAPFSFPAPSRKAHLSLPACKAPFFKVPVIW